MYFYGHFLQFWAFGFFFPIIYFLTFKTLFTYLYNSQYLKYNIENNAR